jgi:hypothetical protein
VGAAVSKLLVSLGAGPQRRLLSIARRTFEPYAERHGYELALHDESPETSRPAPWGKVRLLRDAVREHEAVLWLDADLMIVDPRRDIADELTSGHVAYLVEHELASGRMPNTGVLLLRGGDEAAALLDELWAQEDLIDHRWWENAALCRMLGYELDPPRLVRPTPWLERTRFVDPRWNSIHDAPAPRPYIRHYPGYSLKTRTAFMLRDLVWRRR